MFHIFTVSWTIFFTPFLYTASLSVIITINKRLSIKL